MPDMPRAMRLAKLLDSFLQSARAHLARGGLFAEVGIVTLRFDPRTVEFAFDEAKTALGQEPPQAKLCLGTAPVLKLSRRCLGGSHSLRLHLAMHRGAFLVTARSDSVPPEAFEMPRDRYFVSAAEMTKHQQLTMDLVSLGPELTLSYKGADLRGHKNQPHP